MSSPLIAVVHIRRDRPHAPDFQRELDALTASTVREIVALGGTARVIAAAEGLPEDTLRAATACAAIVLLGGEDVDPAFYGGPRDYPEAGPTETIADRVQIDVLTRALREGTPVLGICRGLQLANVALGGTLIQHLDGHRGDPFVTTSAALVGDHLAREVADGAEHRCTHHQAIGRLGHGLVIAARGDDGVIEAVVHESDPFTGVQWHPEHPETASAQLRPLLRRLLWQIRDVGAGRR